MKLANVDKREAVKKAFLQLSVEAEQGGHLYTMGQIDSALVILKRNPESLERLYDILVK